jgi:hypothetical protein
MAPTYTAKMRVQYSIHWSWFYGWQPLSVRWEQTTLQRAQLAGFHRRIAGATFAKKRHQPRRHYLRTERLRTGGIRLVIAHGW